MNKQGQNKSSSNTFHTVSNPKNQQNLVMVERKNSKSTKMEEAQTVEN